MSHGMEIQEGLGQYAQETERLQRSLLALATRWGYISQTDLMAIGDYVGSGARSLVFKLPRTDVVIKLGMASLVDDYDIDFERQRSSAERSVNALRTGKGLEYAEQLRAFRLSDIPAIATTYVPGQTMSGVSPYDLPAAPEPYLNLTRTWRAMEKRRLKIDGVEGNTIWSGKDFTVIDYLSVEDFPHEEINVKGDALEFAEGLLPGENGDMLPHAALAFRDVCRSEFGNQVATSMENVWLAHEYIIPRALKP